MTAKNDGPARHEAPAPTESELVRSQRDVNEQLVLATLRAHEAVEAAEAIANELRASEAQLRTLADMLPLLAWYANPDGYIPWYNRRWFEYTGANPGAQEGWNWQAVHDPDDLPRILEKWNAALTSGEPWEDEFRLRRHDGQYRWFLSRAVPLRNASGQIVRWFGTNVDIDDQKRDSAVLRRRTMLATLAVDVGRAFALGGALEDVLEQCCAAIVRELDAALTRIWAVDETGTMLELRASVGMGTHLDGPRARVRIGAREGGWLATAREAYVTNDVTSNSHIDDHEWACHAGMKAFAGYPLVIAGQLVGVLSVFSRHVLDEDVPVALAAISNTIAIGIARQREERERARLLISEQEARKEAEAANRVKDEFLATISHELRTPLNAILGWSLLLRRDPHDTKAIELGLATIERNAQSQARLVDDILDVSRIISGKLRLDMRRVDMNAIARAAVDVVRPAAEAKMVHFVVKLPPDEERDGFIGDSDRLQQIAWNLLSNAVKFTPPEGTVTLRLERIGSTVCITVHDTGSGIPPEHLPFIFERFRQVDSSTTRRHGGLGLGLAIVRHLVELHGGTATVESSGLGFGSTFIVTLPIRAIAEVEAERRGAEGKPPRMTPSRQPTLLSGVKILVVDDDDDSRFLLERALTHAGALVSTVDSARTAMAFIESQTVDVLISDIAMPGEDGFSLMRRVRALPASRGGQTPALALTAYARTEDALLAHRAGFQSHLAKPADLVELTRSVAKLALLATSSERRT